MRLFIDMKPVKKVASTKQGIRYGIRYANLCLSDVSKWSLSDGANVYGVNYEKHRKKVVDGKLVAAHWVGYVYKFPHELLHSLNLRVVQNKRNFKLEKVK
jgi:hypothetical protein